MEVAVAQVSEDDQARTGKGGGQRRVAFGQEFGNGGDRQRNVVLDVGAFATLRFADVLAQRPQPAGLLAGLCDDRVQRDRLAYGGLSAASASAASGASVALSSAWTRTYQGWPGNG